MGLSPKEIAEKIGVNKSTVTRWVAQGKLSPQKPPVQAVLVAAGKLTPTEWASAVRGQYDLDDTDDQLVTLAETALLVSRDVSVSPQARMTAAGRFQSIVKQLALVMRVGEREDAKPTEPAPPERKKNPAVPRRSSVDPRKALH